MTFAKSRLKYLCAGAPQYGLNISSDEYSDDGVRLLRTSDIDDSGNLSATSPVFVAPEVAVKAPLRANDILLSRSGTVGRAFRITPPVLPATHAGYLVRFRPSPNTEPRFLEWGMRSRVFADQVALAGIQSTISNVNAQKYSSMLFPSPPLPVQRKIADFLDRETERIDALIDKKRRLIDLLEEKRTATITHAVTKGLDPTAPMKDSGIPWIGQIPEHWEVTTVSRAATVRYGLGQPPPESEDGVPIIRATNINRGRISKNDLLYVDLADLPLDRAPLLVEGEILVVRSGALTGDSAIVTAQWAGSAPGYDLRVTPSAVRAEFLAWFFLSRPGLEQMWLASTRAAQPHLNAEELGQVGLPLPPSVEQAAIAGYIASRLGQLDLLSDRIASQLSLLAEYREALITAAVTGGIDVDTFDNNHSMKEATT